jgi:phytanoyl-CoA hydroxylase
MLTLETPNGILVEVPENDSEDFSPKFSLAELDQAQSYYEENGYVIFDNLIDPHSCDEVRRLWDVEVKGADKFIYRQATAKAEKNILNEKGWVMNPILNLQSINPIYFEKLRNFSVANILTTDGLKNVFTRLLGESPKIVQSMYFEGNSATWEHQDSYYLDSEHIGSMAAAWIALEDISPTAGRFFLCPGTHKIDLGKQSKETNIAENHDVYIGQVVKLIKDRNMPIRAPKLDKGDVLIWNAWTIHGSLKSNDGCSSRSSITCHAIKSSDLFLQLHTRKFDVPCDVINGVKIWRPKDQGKLKNRFILLIESSFPSLFYGLKRLAIKFLVSRN